MAVLQLIRYTEHYKIWHFSTTPLAIEQSILRFQNSHNVANEPIFDNLGSMTSHAVGDAIQGIAHVMEGLLLLGKAVKQFLVVIFFSTSLGLALIVTLPTRLMLHIYGTYRDLNSRQVTLLPQYNDQLGCKDEKNE